VTVSGGFSPMTIMAFGWPSAVMVKLSAEKAVTEIAAKAMIISDFIIYFLCGVSGFRQDYIIFYTAKSREY
jgi:hypothetical protein